VLESSCPLPKPVLAVQSGTVRRQAKLEVQLPFMMPHPEDDKVEVCVMQQLATQLLPVEDDGEVYCAIPVKGEGGKRSQVTLRVQKSKVVKKKKALFTPSSRADPEASREYLESHNLQQRVQCLIQGLLQVQPEDPYRFMVNELKRSLRKSSRTEDDEREADRDASQASHHKVPRPPEGPTPKGRPVRRRGTMTNLEERRPFVPKARWTALSEDLPLSRAVIRSVLESDRCLHVGVEAVQTQTQKGEAQRLCDGIMKLACERVIAEQAGPSSYQVTRALLADLFKQASTRMSEDNHKSLVQWAIRCSLHGALNIFNADQDEYSECATSWRRWSLPQPVVNLTPSSHWVRWLQ